MRNLSNWVTPLAVYDGSPTSDDTTSDQPCWKPITIDRFNPRVLFIVHGIVEAASDAVLTWKVLGTTCDSPSVYAEYTAISGATGTISPVASETTYGPFLVDVNCAGYTSVVFNAYSCDNVYAEMHCVALGYGGKMPYNVASDYVSV